jgi:hypothetical protein
VVLMKMQVVVVAVLATSAVGGLWFGRLELQRRQW